MVGSKVIVFLISTMLLNAFSLSAAVNRYAIYFTDKANNDYSIDRPEEFLSERSLTRREKNNAEVTIVDLPVTNNYLAGLRLTGAEVFYSSRWLNAALVQCDDDLILAIETLEFVKSVELLAKGERLSFDGTDFPDFENELEPASFKISTDEQLELIGADEMHKDGFTGEGVYVAVFDAGFPGVKKSVAFKDIFEENRLNYTWDYVSYDSNVYKSNSHGTQVLSCIAGKIDNKFMGTAFDANIALFITEDVSSETRIEEFNWVLAAEKCDSLGVDVINSSVGYFEFDIVSQNYTHEDINGDSAMVTIAADIAASKGILVVTSAGNEGTNDWGTITVPADADSILAVGAVNSNSVGVNFSSPGPTADNRIKPDISALGSNVTVITSSGNVVSKSGTSFASPTVAGFCASLMEANPQMTVVEIISMVKASGSNSSSPDAKLGYGIPNYSVITSSSIINFEKDFEVYPNPLQDDKLFVKFKRTKPKGGFSLDLVDLNGNSLGRKEFLSYKKKEILEFSVDVKNPGLYFLLLKSENFNRKVKLLKF